MIVVCTYKSGGDFTADHVAALKKQLVKYMPCNFEFWCFTDMKEEVALIADKVIPLIHNLPGWWSKIELFRPVYHTQLVVYFDLDVMIRKDLDEFIDIVEDFRPLMLRSADRVGRKNDWPSSSIMAWQGNELNAIYTTFFADPRTIEKTQQNTTRAGQRTDQGFIRTVINPRKFQDYLPDHYVLFKIEYLRQPKYFQQATILNWTGRPRYQQMVDDNHIKKEWNEYAN